MKELTKAEEQIMHVLWKLKKAFVKDIIDDLPEPKPAYNTVSTIIRILEKKGFVEHNAYGKTYEYFPAIEKKDYTKHYFKNFMQNYFGNSFKQLFSFFSKDNEISINEMEEMMRILEQQIHTKKEEEN